VRVSEDTEPALADAELMGMWAGGAGGSGVSPEARGAGVVRHSSLLTALFVALVFDAVVAFGVWKLI
jgi:hypothetical protein